MITRRQWLTSAALATCGTALAQSFPATARRFATVEPVTPVALEAELKQLEAASGGRLGVALLNTATGHIEGHRLNERFPMCSTFKVLAVAAVLQRVDLGKESLDRRIIITPADVLRYAPISSKHIGAPGMTIAELCTAAITLSDNTAANLLLKTIGGPVGVTHFVSTLGDPMTRLDRTEPTLNEAIPYDPRDTTTPLAMAKDLEAFFIGTVLSPHSRTLLKNWMLDCKTGNKEIRAGVPKSFLVADKTGNGQHNTSNDIAVVYQSVSPFVQPYTLPRPGDAIAHPTPLPIAPHILTVYLTDAKSSDADTLSAIIAKVATLCFPDAKPVYGFVNELTPPIL